MTKLNGRALYWVIFALLLIGFTWAQTQLFYLQSGIVLHALLYACNTVVVFGFAYFNKEIKRDLSI